MRNLKIRYRTKHTLGTCLERVFKSTLLIWGLFLAVSLPLHAETTLEQWRTRIAEISQMAENDFVRANAEALILQNDVPADASPIDRVRLLNLLARIDIYLGRTEPADERIRQAFELAQLHDDRIGQAEADLNMALNTVNQARIDKMNEAVIRAMTELEGVDRPELLAEAMLRTSMMYRRMEQLDDSVAIAVQALDIAKRSGNAVALAYAYQGMAAAYDINHRSAEALEYYRNMHEQAIAAHSKRLEAESLLAIGGSLHGTGDFVGGEAATRQSIEMFRILHAPFYLAHALIGLAENLRIQNRVAEALPLLDETVGLYEQGNNKIGLWWALNFRSSDYLMLGKSDLAYADAERSYQQAKEIGFPLYLSKSAKTLAGIAAVGGDHKRAYELMMEADGMATQAAAVQASTRMVDLAQHYQNEIKQRQIDELNRRNERQEAEISQRSLEQRWLWTVLAASLILLAVILFFMGGLRRSHNRLWRLNKQVEQAKNKLQATLDVIPDLMFEVDLNGRYFDCHSPQSELLISSRESLLGKTIGEMMPTEAAAICLEALYEAREYGRSFGKQILLPLPHGECWFELSVALKPAEDGEMPHFIVMSRDISERKQAEKLLHERGQAILAVVENSPDYIVRYDRQLRRIYVNPTLQKLFGLPIEQILGTTPEESTPLQEGLVPMLNSVFECGRELQVEMPFRNAGGEMSWAHLRSVPEFGPDGSIVSVLSIGRDITERKRLEIDLQVREQYQRAMLDNFSFMVWLKDTDSRLLSVNRPYLETAGLPADAAYFGKTDLDLFPTELAEQYRADDREVMRSGQRKTVEEFIGTPGALRWHETSKAAVFDSEGKLLGTVGYARDITERKLAEIALRESELRYREIFENVSDSLYLLEVTPDGRFRNLAFNFAFETATGIAREELIGRYVGEANVDEESAKIVIRKYQRCLDAGVPIEDEAVLDLPIGRRTFYSTLIPLRDELGRIYRILGIARDVTEIKRAERKLRTLAENAPDNICRYDRQCRILYLNPPFEAMLGLKADDVLGRTPIELFADGRFADYQTKVANVIATGMADEIELKIPDEGNGVSYCHFRLVAERDAGEIVGVLAIGRDISEHKRAAAEIHALNLGLEQRVLERTEELRQQTRYLRTIIDALPMLIWLKDVESRFVMVNQATALSCRMTALEMVGKTDIDFWPDERAKIYIAEDREVMATRQRKIIEQPFSNKQGSSWIEIDKVPVLDEDGSVLGTVGVVRNISERKTMEAAREAALVEAERLARLRSEFMAQMSHELRTPLNGILGYAQVLRREKRLTERQDKMLAVIQQSGEHLLNLINDILDFAKIEAGKQELVTSDISLRNFLRNLSGIVSIKAEQKQLAFVCEVADDVPDGIRADETRLRQVLLNLLSNAVKFCDTGCVNLRVLLLSNYYSEIDRSPSVSLRFEVKDSGIGIAPGQLESIFQPFEQVADGLHRETGTGLGLPICRELVRLMGGDIRVDSRYGLGSCFWFDLDLPVVDVYPVETDLVQQISGYQGPVRRVLVVDDIRENRGILIEMLSRLGFETQQAADGEQCLLLAEAWAPDLILLDLVMPKMDGLETVRCLRDSTSLSQTPVIAVSASASCVNETEAMSAGVDAFLPKPIDLELLMVQIGKLLKLDWVYSVHDTEAPTQKAIEQCLEVPSTEEMRVLHRLAMEGSMRDIIRQSRHLEELDERYRPFAQCLRSLAQGYQSKAVLDLVERYIDKN